MNLFNYYKSAWNEQLPHQKEALRFGCVWLSIFILVMLLTWKESDRISLPVAMGCWLFLMVFLPLWEKARRDKTKKNKQT